MYLGDLGDGDAERLACATDVRFDGFCARSCRLLFKDLKLEGSKVGVSDLATPVGSDEFTLNAGVAAEVGAWSDAMR